MTTDEMAVYIGENPRRIFLIPQTDGTVINWGRHVTVGGIRGSGGARVYFGEDAAILRLVLKHSKKR